MIKVCLICGWLMVGLAARAETAFWVWNRSEALSSREKADLRAAGVKTLYWHFAEIENKTGAWEWKRPPHLPEKTSSVLRIVPVVRLETSFAQPFNREASSQLQQRLSEAFRATGADEWQLDYDAPDRLVGDYADFLALLRPLAPKLSSTALADWVRLPAFSKLRQSVAELCPMFYDLTPDTANALLPLLDQKSTRTLMKEWAKACDIPWRAGLPWFARITVYGADGRSRGHFRQWYWDDIIFKRGLLVETPLHDGITVLRARESVSLGRSTIHRDERLVLRWPDRPAIVAMEKEVARDMVFFRLPDAAASSGGSLPQFAARDHGSETKLTLRRDGDKLVLMNEGPTDLPARIVGDGPQDRGYELEVEGAGPVFREALPGDFWRLAGHIHPDSDHPNPTAVGFATRLTFWFSALPAGQSLSTGLFQLNPAAEAASLRYRILNLVEKTSWLSIDPSH